MSFQLIYISNNLIKFDIYHGDPGLCTFYRPYLEELSCRSKRGGSKV